MPWPERQRRAIFLNIKRKKGEKAAREFMHRHGYGGRTAAVRKELRKRKGRHHGK